MNGDRKTTGFTMARREPRQMDEIVQQFLKLSGLCDGMNVHRMDIAWDQASGVGPYTLSRSFVNGTYYVTLASSVVRNQLSFRKEDILRTMNDILMADPLFSKDSKTAGFVKKLVLR